MGVRSICLIRKIEIMTITELNTMDLHTINGGTNGDYNNGRNKGAVIREFMLKRIPYFYC